ncbi:MAG: MCE family protein [Leptospiraceae bacterium]|nr:MCE family protein [Leptospiraceae bacterium]
MKPFQYLLVGSLFFGALMVVGYFTIVTEGGPFKKEVNTMKIFFPNADGLKVGSKVTVQGVPFGYVSKVSLIQVDEFGNILTEGQEGHSTKVEVTLVIQSPLKIYENYDIKIKNESLLSGRMVAIDPGSETTLSTEGEKIPGDKKRNRPINIKDNTSFNKLEGKTSEDPLSSLSELISENRGDLRKIISNIADVTGKINNGNGTIGKLINSDELHSGVNTTLTDAQIVLRELREGLEDTREQAPVTSFIRAALTAF